MRRLAVAAFLAFSVLASCIGATAAWAAASFSTGFVQPIHVQELFTFATGSNGHLYVNWWDGFGWHWADQGLPGNGQPSSLPAAIAYPDASGVERISVFVRSADGSLNENYWDGTTWRWYSHGRAPGMNANYTIGGPAAVTYRDQNGVRQVYVFVCGMSSGSDGPHLYLRWWNGSLWQWSDQGRGCAGTTDSSAITYLDRDGLQRLFAFVTSPSGHLLVNYWDGRSWHWADQGLPPDGMNIVNGPAPASMSYADALGVQHLYVFAEGGSGHIYVNWWDGGAWRWADQGVPLGGPYLENPAALTYRDTAGVQWINVYTGANFNPHLYNNWWDGTTWRWNDQARSRMRPASSGPRRSLIWIRWALESSTSSASTADPPTRAATSTSITGTDPPGAGPTRGLHLAMCHSWADQP